MTHDEVRGQSRRSRALSAACSTRAGVAATLLAFGLTSGAAQGAPVESDVNGIIPYPSTTRTLDNGLKVIVMPMPTDGLVTYWTIVRTGSRDEYEPGRTGFAHFFEHMMFRGTERYPAERYNHILTAIGANANAYTTDDYTAYHITMAAEDLEQVVDVESDRFQHLSYAEAAFQTEAGAVYGEYRKTRTEPNFALFEALQAKAFEKHPYGHTTMGYERDIAAMPKLYDYSRQFFARYYRPENSVIFVAGDVQPDRVLALVERYYGQWQPGYVAPQIPTEPEQHEERHVEVSYPGQTLPMLSIVYKLPAFDASDRVRVAADLLADLAFGETSEAYRKLVLEDQAVEYIDAGAQLSRDPGLFEISTRVKDAAKIDEVRGVIDATIAQYRAAPPDADRVAALERRIKYGFLMGLQTPDSVANRLAQPIAVGGDLATVERLYATYAEITPADVQTAARRYLDAEHRTVGVLRARQ